MEGAPCPREAGGGLGWGGRGKTADGRGERRLRTATSSPAALSLPWAPGWPCATIRTQRAPISLGFYPSGIGTGSATALWALAHASVHSRFGEPMSPIASARVTRSGRGSEEPQRRGAVGARPWAAEAVRSGGQERPGYVRCGIPQDTRWIGPVVLNARARCRRCGRWLEVRRKLKTPPRLPTIGLPCASCQVSTAAQYSLAHPPPTAAIDQCFGLPLVLQTACAGHTLWAYNPEHLAFLRAYLEADLREDHATSHSSAASRLPRWLKLARHRAEALRAVARLERRLRTAR